MYKRQGFEHARVIPLIDAKRGEVYASHPQNGLQCMKPSQLSTCFDSNLDYLFCGDGAVVYADIILELFPSASINSDEVLNRPNAAYLPRLIDIGKPDQIATLQPQYVRPSDAELTYPDGFPDAVKQFQF